MNNFMVLELSVLCIKVQQRQKKPIIPNRSGSTPHPSALSMIIA
jgi:hypothetical protein